MERRCARCGRKIKKNEVAYRVRIEIIGEFDGMELGEEEFDEVLEKIVEELEGLPSYLIEGDIYQLKEYILCPDCKDQFAANPLNLPLDMDIPHSIPPPEDE
ncbi:hypothetical protein DRQ16_02110 [bacterium]|nr:MAG: hypothetical protein DRQ16_02110 [bacterium]